MPVLIDFGGVKQVEVNVSNFTNLGKVHTRLGERIRPEEQWRQGKSFQQRLVRPGCNSTGVADGQGARRTV